MRNPPSRKILPSLREALSRLRPTKPEHPAPEQNFTLKADSVFLNANASVQFDINTGIQKLPPSDGATEQLPLTNESPTQLLLTNGPHLDYQLPTNNATVQTGIGSLFSPRGGASSPRDNSQQIDGRPSIFNNESAESLFPSSNTSTFLQTFEILSNPLLSEDERQELIKKNLSLQSKVREKTPKEALSQTSQQPITVSAGPNSVSVSAALVFEHPQPAPSKDTAPPQSEKTKEEAVTPQPPINSPREISTQTGEILPQKEEDVKDEPGFDLLKMYEGLGGSLLGALKDATTFLSPVNAINPFQEIIDELLMKQRNNQRQSSIAPTEQTAPKKPDSPTKVFLDILYDLERYAFVDNPRFFTTPQKDSGDDSVNVITSIPVNINEDPPIFCGIGIRKKLETITEEGQEKMVLTVTEIFEGSTFSNIGIDSRITSIYCSLKSNGEDKFHSIKEIFDACIKEGDTPQETEKAFNKKISQIFRAPYRSGEDPHDFDENKKNLPSPISLMFQKQLEDGTYGTEESEEFEKKIFNKEGSQYKSYEYDKDSLGKLMIQRFEASKIIAEPARSPSPTSVVEASATIGDPDSIKPLPLTDAQEDKAPSEIPSRTPSSTSAVLGASTEPSIEPIPTNASPAVVDPTLTPTAPAPAVASTPAPAVASTPDSASTSTAVPTNTDALAPAGTSIHPTSGETITGDRQPSPVEGGGVFPLGRRVIVPIQNRNSGSKTTESSYTPIVTSFNRVWTK